jgi:membrane protein DedA with SNARE-associated domain
MTDVEMPPRKLIGLLLATIGILIGAFLSGSTAVILLGYWNAKETGGWEGRSVLLVSAALGALLGYAIHRHGRRIAR